MQLRFRREVLRDSVPDFAVAADRGAVVTVRGARVAVVSARRLERAVLPAPCVALAPTPGGTSSIAVAATSSGEVFGIERSGRLRRVGAVAAAGGEYAV